MSPQIDEKRSLTFVVNITLSPISSNIDEGSYATIILNKNLLQHQLHEIVNIKGGY
jgi:hypothetical protein